jgi:branched-chain amino acid transport system substrate-binding protein
MMVLSFFGSVFGGSPVTIGTLLDVSGKTREVGTAALRVSEIAVDAVNAQGGVAGRRVELTNFDTRGDPILGRHGARELVSFRNVPAVLGPTNWATAMMAKPFLEEAQVPVMMLTWDDSVIHGGKYGTYDWIFKLPLRRVTALERIGRFVRKNGWTRVGLVTMSDALGREAMEWFKKVGPVYGIKHVVVRSFGPADDIRARLSNLASRDLQVIVSWCSLPHAATVAGILREEGVTLPLFQSHEVSPQEYVYIAGPAARQSLTISNKMLVWKDLEDGDPQKQMIQDFFHRYRNVYGDEQSYTVSPFFGYVWDSIMILVRSMREAGTDRARLRDAIEGIHRHVGLGGVYGFTYQDHNGIDPDSMVVMEVDRIYEDGRGWAGSWRLAN